MKFAFGRLQTRGTVLKQGHCFETGKREQIDRKRGFISTAGLCTGVFCRRREAEVVAKMVAEQMECLEISCGKLDV
ncbi:MAG: hypothetical protein SGJ27_05615 [Candidatus Melainabacteria bacterium]|nr:hypothetical protein [Candidatus Melainabacteria bacterium]